MQALVGYADAAGIATPTARLMNQLGLLYQTKARLKEAEPLFRRALRIDEAAYGPDHPDVATALNNLAELLRATNRPGEAEPLMHRALAILQRFRAATGHEHPNFRTALANYRWLLEDMALPPEEIEERLREFQPHAPDDEDQTS